jgi:two-component system, NarL family, sensor kinase
VVKASRNGIGSVRLIYRIVLPDGRVRWVQSLSEATSDANGQPHRRVGVIMDVTDFKEAISELQHLHSRVLDVQEAERQRLARELHDSTSQELASIGMNIGLVRTLGASLPANARAALDEALTSVEQCSAELRTMAYLLRPPLLDLRGLAEAIREFSDGFARRSGILVDLEIDESAGRMTEGVELALFRVLQEALANVHRHSRSRTVSVRYRADASSAVLEVADRGVGMADPGEGARSSAGLRSGVGILSMRERLREVGGTLTIDSDASGTRVCAVVSRKGVV